MKIEFKRDGKTSNQLHEVYKLYIDGKTYGSRYDCEGGERTGVPWKTRKKQMDKLMEIKCKDYPEELRLFNCPEYELPPGRICVFRVNKRKGQMLFKIWFILAGKYNGSNWPLNPILLKHSIYKHARGTFLKGYGEEEEDECEIYATFTYKSDLKGTIGDKYKMAFETLTQIVKKAEKDVRSAAKSYLR